MKTYKTLLAAVDFSRYSDEVVDQSVTFASAFKSELIFLNVINQRDIAMLHYTYQVVKKLTDKLTLDLMTTRLRRDRECKMDDLMDRIKTPGLESRFITRTGDPFQEIIEATEELKADLVFVGEKGRGDVADAIIGSVTQKLLRKCPVTLVVVR